MTTPLDANNVQMRVRVEYLAWWCGETVQRCVWSQAEGFGIRFPLARLKWTKIDADREDETGMLAELLRDRSQAFKNVETRYREGSLSHCNPL